MLKALSLFKRLLNNADVIEELESSLYLLTASNAALLEVEGVANHHVVGGGGGEEGGWSGTSIIIHYRSLVQKERSERGKKTLRTK